MPVTGAAAIFVHGIFSSPAAWEPIARLIGQDEDLLGLTLLPFEYASPKFSWSPLRRVPNYNVLADNFQTYLDVDAADYSKLILVSHSQGGLIVQRYLARMLTNGRGRDLQRIRRIVMFACPSSGSEVFILARRWAPFFRNPQERELRPINEAVTEAQKIVVSRVVHAECISSDRCPIPIVAYAGESDNVVTPTSARAVFPNTGVIPGDHSSIIRPDSSSHRCYTTLRSNLITALADPFPTGSGPAAADAPVRAPADVPPGSQML